MATIEYMNRVCTVLCFASIYVLINGRKNRSPAKDGGWSPAEIAASVGLALSLAWIVLVPLLRFWIMVRSEQRRSECDD